MWYFVNIVLFIIQHIVYSYRDKVNVRKLVFFTPPVPLPALFTQIIQFYAISD